MSVSEDPVEVGLVTSLNRPGGNITGVTFVSAELAPERLEQLKEILPHASRVAVLLNPTHVDLEYKELEAAAPPSRSNSTCPPCPCRERSRADRVIE